MCVCDSLCLHLFLPYALGNNNNSDSNSNATNLNCFYALAEHLACIETFAVVVIIVVFVMFLA